MCEPAGWIKMHRKMLKWEWYDDINVKTLFIHCLLKANYEDKNWRGTIVKRGSFITSLEHLSIETKLTKRQILTALDKLILTNEIKKVATNKYTMLTILNYDTYQTLEEDKCNTNVKQRENKSKSKGKQTITTKEVEEYKEDKNITTTTTQPGKILKFNPKLFLNDLIIKNHARLYLEFPDLLNDSWHERIIKNYNQEDLIEALKQLNNKMKSGQYHCLGTTIETWTTTVQKSRQRNELKGNPNEYNQKTIGNTAGSEYRTLPGGRVAANFTAEDYQSTWDG